MKNTTWQLYIAPIISVIFVIAVFSIGYFVHVRQEQTKELQQLLSKLELLEADLNAFAKDETYYTEIDTKNYQVFFASPIAQSHIDKNKIGNYARLLSTLKSYTHSAEIKKAALSIHQLIQIKEIQLKQIAFDLQKGWLAIYTLGILSCFFALSSSLLLLLRTKNEKKLIQLKNEKQEAFQLAHDSNEIRKSFLNKTAHEVKTYLNAITGLTENIALKNRDVELQADIKLLQQSNQGLKILIQNSIELGNLDAHSFKLELLPISLRNELTKTVASFKPSCQEKGISISIDFKEGIPDVVLGDVIRLNQVLYNLVELGLKDTELNEIELHIKSMKNTDTSSLLKFTLLMFETEGQKLNSKSKDFETIPLDDMNFLATQNIELTITKKLLGLMNSSLSLKVNPQWGSIYEFDLSFKLPDSSTQKKEKKQKVKTILIADDNRINRMVLVRYLECLKLVTDQAASGKEAIKFANEKNYDVILMDLNMPDIDGIEASKQILAQSKTKPPKIYAVSANSLEVMKVKTEGVEFTGFISKPVDREELINALKLNDLSNTSPE